MVVARDPETGAFTVPTAEQRRRLFGSTPETSRDGAGIVELQGPNGAVGLDLRGRFQDYATVTIGKHGAKTFGCVQVEGNTKAERDSIAAPAPLEEE